MIVYDDVLGALATKSALRNGLRYILMDTKTACLPEKTMGGRYFWEDIASNKGYRLQRNKILRRMRILDPNDMRIASGMNRRMNTALQRMSDYVRDNKELEHTTTEKALEDVLAQRNKLKKLYDSGQISPEGFSTLMKPLAEKIKYLLKIPDDDELPAFKPEAKFVEGFIRQFRVLWETNSLPVKIAAVMTLIPRGLMIIFVAPKTLGPYILSRRKLSPAVKYPAYVLSMAACMLLWAGLFLYFGKER